MSYKNLDTETLNSIKPNLLKQYALNNGWTREGELKDKYFIYRHDITSTQLLVPQDDIYEDYYRRISDAVELISKIEKRSTNSVINDVFLPQGDVLRFRLVGQDYETGTAPLAEGLSLIAGSKKSLFVSALQAINPKEHYLRLRNTEAEDFLNKCRLGQTERGSFITSFICPLGLRSPEQPNMFDSQTPSISTFTRKVTSNFMNGIHLLKTAIDDDNLDVLKEGDTPLVSSNFCDALVEMKPSSLNARLDISAKFSTKDLIPSNIKSSISIRADYFSQIEQISNELRPEFDSETQTVFAKVDSCLGQPNKNGDMEGEVILVFIDEETQAKAKIYLKPNEYQLALDAHGHNRYIKVSGNYKPSSRVGRFLDYKVFEAQ